MSHDTETEADGHEREVERYSTTPHEHEFVDPRPVDERDQPLGEWLMHDLSAPLDGWYVTRGRHVILSFVVSRDEGKGHLTKLLAQWMTDFDRIEVPTPSDRMRGICERRGFSLERIWFPPFNEYGECMVWTRARVCVLCSMSEAHAELAARDAERSAAR